jgi:two-component system, NtrC family, response regulator AlgB
MPRRDVRYSAHDHSLSESAENSLFLQSRSPAMRRLLESAEQAAASDATILLIGEGGTGKGLLAKQIHLWSPRRTRPFVSIDCIRLTQRSRDSEKSGYVLHEVLVGMTHAPERLGATEGGTLFLSGIDQLSPGLQIELARFVSDRTVMSAEDERTVDLRIIAASDRDLVTQVKIREFREDLFYGLNIIALRLPPLRERVADIAALAASMLDAAAIRNGRSHLQLSSEAAAAITRYNWPGNVRELRNAMEAAAVLCEGETVHSANLPEAIYKHASGTIVPTSPKASLDEIERQHILRVLSESPTLEKAAATLGINVTTLYRKRKRYNLDVSDGSKVR